MKILKWDTQFFGFTVAEEKIDSLGLSNIYSIENKAKLQNVKLVYIYSNKQLPAQIITHDNKVTYQLHLNHSAEYNSSHHIIEYTKQLHNANILPIVFQSGTYSRFFLDPQIPKNKFYEMYEQWFQKSLNHELAKIIFCKLSNEKPVGFISLNIDKNNTGSIGLLAVDEKNRGQNIATDLLIKSFEYFSNHNVLNINVVTQSINIPACKFYEKHGFQVCKSEYIHHLWVKE